MSSAEQRNYQLDVLKLFFTFVVILNHSISFVNENTATWFFPEASGFVSVHFFFICSGLLMVNSYKTKKPQHDQSCGIESFNFVVHKFKAISTEYWTSLFIGVSVYIVLNIQRIDVFQYIICSIPEFLGVSYGTGVMPLTYNIPAWYISAMLLAMLPLYYIMRKNETFFIYVFSPVAALLLYGYMYNYDGNPYIGWNQFTGVAMGGFIRAVCGILFGVVGYIIFTKIVLWCKTKKQKIMVTIAEILLWVLFFVSWFSDKSNYKTMYATMLLLPFCIGITFSGKSYISQLFKVKFLKHTSKISLALYLNHYAAHRIVSHVFGGRSYKQSVALMIGFTVVFVVIYFIIIKLFRFLHSKIQKKL